ncbi:MAG TPA: DUF503 domain-containing protein [Desulfovibrio sp.]|uniref:DUF503 domain-containing protein n=1 Tax=Desulfovibrio sp. TaxID=885 RepID=UPI002B56343B|nr:DUF503 domain-containing protein [Desulfovibrio sp.]HMM40014.1 DUF503 domain-containing protein [Desulfovibrio sp.]
MIIGTLTLGFRLHGNDSLKGKRKVAQSLKQKLRNSFNLAVSEVDALDSHERLVLAAVTVGNETKVVEGRLAKALNLVEAAAEAELVHCETEIFSSSPEE